MKRLLPLFILCLALCFAQGLFACAEEWEEETIVAESSVTVQIPLHGAAAEIRAKEIDGETWLFLPAFADVETLYPEAYETDEEGVWYDDETGMYLMRSENLRTLFLFSDDPVNQGRAYIEGSPRHETYTTASMALVDTDGRVSHAGDIRKLRGRGNGTWRETKPRRPYQFKLEERADLLDIGQSARTWVLLADITDGTFLHNRIALDLALELGMEETSRSEHVDLYYDGEYRGLYLLCEKVEIGESRVDERDYDDLLETWNDKVGQRDLNILAQKTGENRFGQPYTYVDGVVESSLPDAGGYLLELRNDGDADKGRSHFYVSDGSCFESKNPENASQAMMEHVSSLMQEGLDALIHGGVNPHTGRTVEELFDVDSFARTVLVNELAYNLDGFTFASSYFVLPAGERRFRAGPVWDVDLAWRYMVDHTNDGGVGLKSVGGWINRFYGSQAFMDAAKRICQEELLPAVREILLGEKRGRYLRPLSEYAAEIGHTARMNNRIWSTHGDYRLVFASGFDAEIELLTQFITERSAWMEETFAQADCDPERVELEGRTLYLRMKEKFTLNALPWSRASVRDFKLHQETEADEENYALWRLEAIVDPAPGHVFSDPQIVLNGTEVPCRLLEDGGASIEVLLEDATYRPVDYYGEDIGMVYDYETYISNYPEVAEECEYDPELVMDYFCMDGMYEGHRGNAFFDPVEILRENPKLMDVWGEEWWFYYSDFCLCGWEDQWKQRVEWSYLPHVVCES